MKLALNSVLGQTFKNFEIIIVNDGGCNVKSIAEEAADGGAAVNYTIHNSSHGVASSRNTGLKRAVGRYVAYLDDDDIFYPNHLQTLIDAAETTRSYFLYSQVCHAETVKTTRAGDDHVRKKLHPAQKWTFDEMLSSNRIPTLAILHRRELLNHCGYFDEKLSTHEDWDLWIRLMAMGKNLYVPKLTGEYRTDSQRRSLTSDERHDFLKSMDIVHARYLSLAVDQKAVTAAQKTARWELECELKGNHQAALRAHRLNKKLHRLCSTIKKHFRKIILSFSIR